MTKRTLIAVPGNFYDLLNQWRKKEKMSWDRFGLYLARRSDYLLEKEGIVQKFKMIAGNGKARKSIAFSIEVFQRLDLAKKQRKCNWNEFFRFALSNRDEEVEFSPSQSIEDRLDLRKSSSRYTDFVSGKCSGAAFYFEPETMRLIEKAGNIDRKIEAFILREVGGEEPEKEENPDSPNQPKRRLLRTLPEDSLSEGSPSQSVPSSSFRYTPSATHEETFASFTETRIEINSRMVKFQVAPKGNIDPKSLSAPQRRWLKFHDKWIAEAKRWEIKDSRMLAWPEGTRVRVLPEREEKTKKNHIWEVEAYFIYDLLEWDSFVFIEPYRLDFSIEPVVVPGAPARIEEREFKSFSFGTYQLMQKAFLNREQFFCEMTKHEGR